MVWSLGLGDLGVWRLGFGDLGVWRFRVWGFCWGLGVSGLEFGV